MWRAAVASAKQHVTRGPDSGYATRTVRTGTFQTVGGHGDVRVRNLGGQRPSHGATLDLHRPLSASARPPVRASARPSARRPGTE